MAIFADSAMTATVKATRRVESVSGRDGATKPRSTAIPAAAPNSPPLTVGAVNLPTFAIVIAMTLITAPLGVRLAHAMDPKPLKRVFAVFLILVALNMLRKSLGL